MLPAAPVSLQPAAVCGISNAGNSLLASTLASLQTERTKIEARRAAVNLRMSQIFDEVDLVITATNPDIAFAAEGPLPNTFGGIKAGGRNNGLLTFPCNLHGNPGISVPAGFVNGLPVGLQIIGPHFSEQILLELALRLERERPWPLVATGAPI